MTEIWAVRTPRILTERQMRLAEELLPPERLARLHSAKRNTEPLCAYAALRLALWKTAGRKRLPALAQSPAGKPFFPGEPELCFNLSHTGGAVLAGVSTLPLGVDIEKIRPMKEQAMERLTGETEAEPFFQNWVRREAVAKRDGTGFRALMTRELAPEPLYRPFTPFPGYAAGAAMTGGAEFALHVCTAEELFQELDELYSQTEA